MRGPGGGRVREGVRAGDLHGVRAPAPDPCAEAFLRLVGAVRAYEKAGGNREDLELRGKEARVYGVLDRE